MSNRIKTIVKGSAWTTASTVITSIVQLMRLAILTRFLDVSAFGLIAILTLILGLTNTFADLGFSAAIMHKKGLTRREFSSLYWIQFSIYTIIYFVIWGLAIPISSFYNEPQLSGLIPLIMLDLLFYGIGKLYDTLLLKKLQYKILAVRNIICCFISLAVAVWSAYYGWGIYSLIFSTLSQTLIVNMWNFIAGQKYISISFSYDVKSNFYLIKIGLYQTGAQIMDYLSSKLDILILGKVFGADELGLYSLAKELILKVYNLTNGILNKVLLPIFAQIQEDIKKSQFYYCKLLESTSIVNYFGYMILGAFAPQFVLLIYGESYMAIVPLLVIFSFWGLFTSVGNPIGNIVVAFGRTDLSFWYTIIRILISGIVIWYASKFGLEPMAISQVLLAALLLQVTYRMILKPVIKIQWKRWVGAFGPMLVLTSGLIAIGFYLNTTCDLGSKWAKLVILVLILIGTYFCFAFKFYWTLMEELIFPLFGKLLHRAYSSKRKS